MSNQQNLPLKFSSHTGNVSPGLREQVQALAAKAQVHDTNPPLSEQTFIDLAQAADHQLTAIFAHHHAPELATDHLVGVAVALRNTESEPWVVELVVDPENRERKVATGLLEQLKNLLGDLSAVQSWAHGDHPGAQKLAAHYGLVRHRDLNKMRRSASDKLPTSSVSGQVTIRSFVPGQDDQAWLQANATAFADHPEQGGLSQVDLDARKNESWFDPAGFFLAVDAQQQIQGFHWTKLVEPEEAGAERVGEVYVVGVLPTAQGLGLGKALTAVGVNHLLDRGVDAVMLYVDADNTAAVKLYKSLGFTVWDVDVMYGPAR